MVFSAFFLALGPTAFAGGVVLHDGSNGSTAVRVVAETAQVDGASLEAQTLGSLLGGAPISIAGGDALPGCDGGDLTSAQDLAELLKKQIRDRQAFNHRQVGERADALAEALPCMAQALDGSVLAQFYVEAAAGWLGGNEPARADAALAQAASIDAQTSVTGQGRPAALQARWEAVKGATPAAGRLVLLPPAQGGSLFVDGRALALHNGSAEVPAGQRAVQLKVGDGLQTRVVTVSPGGVHTVVVPAWAASTPLSAIAQGQTAQALDPVLAEVLPKGTPVYALVDGKVYEGAAGQPGWSEVKKRKRKK